MDIPTQAGSKRRGFASMDPQRQRQIASQGGRAAHAHGTAHEFSSEEAREAGRKGGEAVSQNREHMAAIGRRGGEASGGGQRNRRGTPSNASADAGLAPTAPSQSFPGRDQSERGVDDIPND